MRCPRALSLPAVRLDRSSAPLPAIGFASPATLPLDVAAVTFANEVAGGVVAEPARDMRFDLSEWPGNVVRRWAQKRLRAAGDQGEARVVLLESRFVAVPLDTAGTLEGFFTDEQSVAYEGSLAVRVEIVGHPSGDGFAEARSYRRRTVPEACRSWSARRRSMPSTRRSSRPLTNGLRRRWRTTCGAGS